MQQPSCDNVEKKSQAHLQCVAVSALAKLKVAADLFTLEDMLVELLLQTLICQVDTQLLKAVLLEALEPIDVQDANSAL